MAIRNYRAGNFATDTPADILVLAALTSAADNYMTLESPVGTDYTVPGGKTLYIVKAIFSNNNTGIGFKIGYGDTGVANGAAAPTNFVQITENMIATQSLINEINLWAAIPTGKLPCIRQGAGVAGNAHVTIMAVEI